MTDSPPQVPWIECPTLDLDLELPPTKRFARTPPLAVEQARALLDGIEADLAAADERLTNASLKQIDGRFTAEAESFAAVARVPARRILMANLSYDLSIAMFACSTIALATPDGPVLARNMDWWPEDLLARASWHLRYIVDGAVRAENLGWPGSIGVVTGQSSRGFALAINAVIGPEKPDPTGKPVLLHLRRVLDDAAGFDEAVRLCSETKLTVAALITVVGTENHERIVIERTPDSHAVRSPERDEPLITTNDYRVLHQPRTHMGAEIYQTTCARFDALTRMLRDATIDRVPTDAELLYYLTDGRVIQGITAQHAVMRPRTGEARLYAPRRLVAIADE